MIQETYRIPLSQGDGCTGFLDRVGQVLEKARGSTGYRGARSVYAKLLTMQVPMDVAEEVHGLVQDGLPKAVVAGMCVSMTFREPNEPYVLLSLCCFERSIVTILRHDGDPREYGSAGRQFGQRIARMRDAKAVEMFCVVLNIDLAPFVMGLSEANEGIPIFGSLAGMNQEVPPDESRDSFFDQERINVVFDRNTPIECFVMGNGFHRSGIVMAVFSGRDLHVQADYLLGWKPLGKEMVVTDAPTRTCAATIDGIPAAGIYRKYLRVSKDARFLMNICDFPMIMERDGCLIARTPPIFDEEGRLYFTGDIHPGEAFRLSCATPEDLLREAREEGRRMRAFHPESLFLIICPNRAIFLGDEEWLEIAPYQQLHPQLAVSHGPGEIYRFQGKGGVLNSSFLAIAMREGDCPAETCEEEEEPSCRTIPRFTRLAAFLDATATELKEMAEKAEAASVAKSQFLSNMSHEIRTPINAILGMDEMILREATDETVLEYAENIRMAGNSLLGLINDILDFSKIESGKLDIIPVEYDLSAVLNDLVNMIQGRAEKKGLCFAVQSDPELPSVLYGDEIRIKQVATNILTNAVKYTEHGFVALSVSHEAKDEDTIFLKVSVSDTGIGIKEEDIRRLFSAFERIEEKRNRTIEGTGLGMNITRQLLALMDSELDVKSVYGKGSTFSFVLEQKVVDWKPMGDLDEAYRRSFALRQEYHEAFIAPGAHVLVVDDTPMNLTVVKGLLKRTLVQIDTAESGKECLELARRRKYDLILLDHRMPGMDGIETLKAMRSSAESLNSGTPAISLTANAVSGARKEYIDAGFVDYMTKPIDGHELERAMLQYLPPEKLAEGAAEDIPDEPEDRLPGWISQVTDLDTAAGIECCGSVRAYLDALTVFAGSIVQGAKEIARYYEEEDWQDFTTKVHALKSTSRIIGASDLSERAKRLEDAGNRRDIEAIRNSSDDLLQRYLAYAFRLAPLCRSEGASDSGKPLIDPCELEEAHEAIREFAASFDYDNVMFVLRSLEDYRLPGAEAKRFRSLREAAEKPDWDRLRELLGQGMQDSRSGRGGGRACRGPS